MKVVKPSWYLGGRSWFDDDDLVKIKEQGLLQTQQIIGANGGTISSLGLISLFDSRDNYNYPTKGTYFETLALPNLNAFGSDFEFTRFSADYVTFLSKGKNILALNLFAVAIAGEAPFNELAFIGGTNKMRGYFEGRHRNRNLMMAQAEYRRFLFWKLGIVGFAGYGVVSRDINDFQSQNIKPSGGLGLRFRLNEDERINLRIDFGYGEKDNSGVYLTIGEAF
jgi:outer membrane protein assembly factor BamA